MSEILNLIKARVSANMYDKTRSLSAEEIRELVSYAIEAPSASIAYPVTGYRNRIGDPYSYSVVASVGTDSGHSSTTNSPSTMSGDPVALARSRSLTTCNCTMVDAFPSSDSRPKALLVRSSRIFMSFQFRGGAITLWLKIL